MGSFLNVLIYRIPRGLTVICGRSFCPHCRKKISWYDNIPLLSYLVLRGKCRHCQKKISLRYPFVEFLTGFMFLISWQWWLRSETDLSLGVFKLLFYWALISGLLVIFFVDLEHLIIPDQMIVFLAAVGLFYNIFTHLGNLSPFLKNYFLVSLLATGFFLLLFWVTRGKGMGFGDVKLVFVLGLVFGFPGTVLAIYLSFLTGALVGIILILTKKSKFGQKIAFGPFLVLGSFLTLFFQKNLEWLIQRIF